MKSLKKVFVLLIFLQLTIYTAQAQKFSEVGLGLGTFLYHGDLTKGVFVFEGFQYSGSLFYRYNISPAFAGKLQFSYGNISSYDYASGFTNRNLHFKSHIAELSLTGQLNIIPLIKKGQPFRKFSPYLFAGVSVFNYNPKAELNGEWYELQPLGTEGQGLAEYEDRDEYKLTQISIPFGIDLRYNLDRKFFLGLELGFRKTFTDYLDDVSTTYADKDLIAAANGDIAAQLSDRRSEILGNTVIFPENGQRGDSKDKDWYYLFNAYITYNFISKKKWKEAKKNPF